MTEAHDWDGSYRGEQPPPWDIGRPQPAFARLADRGLLTGRLLDYGCGTGEHSLLAASHGADATGVDLSPTAIEHARRKADERSLSIRFDVADALTLPAPQTPYDVVLDSGVFHVFDDDDRPRYVASLRRQLRAGGTAYLMCFSDRQPGDLGPRRVSQDELRAAFADGWSVLDIAAETFQVNPGIDIPEAAAWLATLRRD